MGGAAFPTHVKLSPPPEKEVDTLILNGAECEPYLTADHRLMLENPGAVLEGAAISAKILGVKNIYIGVEVNKVDAIEALNRNAADFGVRVVGLKVQYPQGSEKQLIKAITDREVPTGGLRWTRTAWSRTSEPPPRWRMRFCRGSAGRTDHDRDR